MSRRNSQHMGKSKVIHIQVDGIPESVEFFEDDSVEAIRDAFAAAGESDGSAILKLRNAKGNIISITPRIPENTSQNPYTLEVIGARISAPWSEQVSAEKLSELMRERGFVGEDVVRRLAQLEKQLADPDIVDRYRKDGDFKALQVKLTNVYQKIQEAEYLVWLGFQKNLKPKTMNAGRRPGSVDKTKKNKAKPEVDPSQASFDNFKLADVPDGTKEYLRQLTFDNWLWEGGEMKYLMQVMFYELNLPDALNVDPQVLRNFINAIQANYNDNPFHNFRHGFCVTQMMYAIIHLIKLNEQEHVSKLDIACLLVACMGHDLDHPGFNNAYQVNAQTELAIRYNDVSPLENHHCSVLFNILFKPECNVFAGLTGEDRTYARKLIILLVLSTDMAKHGEILGRFKGFTDSFDMAEENHRSALYQMLIKCSDISNEARPVDVAEPWCDCLLEEFFAQSDMEKLEGLPVAPFMDRDKVTKSSAQVGFLNFVIIPLFEQVSSVFEPMSNMVQSIRSSLAYYKELGVAKPAEDKAAPVAAAPAAPAADEKNEAGAAAAATTENKEAS